MIIVPGNLKNQFVLWFCSWVVGRPIFDEVDLNFFGTRYDFYDFVRAICLLRGVYLFIWYFPNFPDVATDRTNDFTVASLTCVIAINASRHMDRPHRPYCVDSD